MLSAALLLTACSGGTPQPQPPSDSTSPSVSLSASQSGTSVNLIATATDDVRVDRVEFYRGSTLISTDNALPYAAMATVSAADNGNVAFTARAYDAAGNIGQDSKTVLVNVTAPSTRTLYQGLWAWGIGNINTGAVIDTGAVLFSEEVHNDGRAVALGIYANQAEIDAASTGRDGAALLGPVGTPGSLDVGFFVGTDAEARVFFVGRDDDDRIDLYDGKPAFQGSGRLATPDNEPGEAVIVVLLQVSDTVPSNAAARETLEARGKTMVGQALKAARNPAVQPAATASSWRFRALQQGLRTDR
ncbi:hypothetical protein GCM10010840_11230 [Deinococcus aerolatus]|uniref:Uncharacterized protein n=2 Tax=Deinococcus aerolatus TaxID=522487 RepID=A0ABQ2G502_9DEIO|nr:hypothetical protein GCM10010840_11230 [Deinococcus aerolatus]